MSGSKSTKSASATKASSSGKGASKTSKPSKIVKFKLSPELLARFTPAPTPSKTPSKISKSKSSASSASTPAVKSASPIDIKAESISIPGPNGTPVPNALAPPGEGSKKKGLSGPKPGTKRGSGVLTEGLPKPKGKPGPKKKPRLDDGTIDNSDANGLLKAPKSSLSTAAPLGDKKLGPKANQGAINAGLRALDRTGTPCRKWVRKGFQLKSFTGVTWQLPSWKPPNTKRIDLSGSSKENSDRMGSSDSKVQGSSAVDSEKSNSGMDFDPTSPITPATAKNGASSPVIVVPATV